MDRSRWDLLTQSIGNVCSSEGVNRPGAIHLTDRRSRAAILDWLLSLPSFAQVNLCCNEAFHSGSELA